MCCPPHPVIAMNQMDPVANRSRSRSAPRGSAERRHPERSGDVAAAPSTWHKGTPIRHALESCLGEPVVPDEFGNVQSFVETYECGRCGLSIKALVDEWYDADTYKVFCVKCFGDDRGSTRQFLFRFRAPQAFTVDRKYLLRRVPP